MSARPKFEASGVIEAPLDEVAHLILRVVPGPVSVDQPNAWLLAGQDGAHAVLTGGPDRFTAAFGHYRLTVEVDRASRTIALQGGWWYRGEHTLEPHRSGTLLVYRVYNVAGPWSRWMVPMANRFFAGFADQQGRQFGEELAAIGRRLGCAVSLRGPARVR